MKYSYLSVVPGARNRHLWTEPKFNGLPVMTSKGPLVAEYLEAVYNVVMRVRQAHPRLFAVRFDLHFPAEWAQDSNLMNNAAISRFWASLKAQFTHNRAMSAKRYERAHDSEFHFVCAREYSPQTGLPHCHCCLFLNAHAFRTVGSHDLAWDNIYSRIVRAWARALRVSEHGATIPVHFCRGGVFKLEPHQSLDGLFEALSYLCKVYSKRFDDGLRCIGTSRVKR